MESDEMSSSLILRGLGNELIGKSQTSFHFDLLQPPRKWVFWRLSTVMTENLQCIDFAPLSHYASISKGS
jgi:hypothetical protein